MEKVPETIDNNVRSLAQKVGSKENPIYLNVITELYAKTDECFAAVEEKIKRNRGSCQLGWQVWEIPGVLIEAEFHAVWKSPEGTLIDITPKIPPVNKILFIPDSNGKYDGARIDNVRLNISGNHLVDDFIRACKAVHHMWNKGEQAYQRKVDLSGDEAKTYHELKQIGGALLVMAKKNLTRNALCFCGSGMKYKHCHSYVLNSLISKSKM